MLKLNWWKIVVGIMLFAFALTVWPGIYRYDHVKGTPIRINRFTGATDVFTGQWENTDPGYFSKKITLVPVQ